MVFGQQKAGRPVKLLIPRLRNILPALVAKDIVGVQPMSMPTLATQCYVTIDSKSYPGRWVINAHSYLQTPQVHAWLEENIPCGSYFHNSTYVLSHVEFVVYNAEDADAFKLVWDGKKL